MLPQYRRFATLRPFLQQIDPAGGGGTNPPIPPADPPKPDDTPLGDAGKAALEAERKAARAAETRAKTAERELADLKAAKAKEEEDKQAEQGEWKTLAEKRDADLKAAATNLETATSELEALRTHVNADIEAAVKDESFKPFLRFDPGKDAPIKDRLKWLAEAKAGLAELPTTDNHTPGNGPGPIPATGKIDERQEVQKIRSRIPSF